MIMSTDQAQAAQRARNLRDRRIRTSRLTIRVIICACLLLTLWASRTELPQIAYAAGSIEPRGALRRIEHIDGGTVARIDVEEGETVARGDPLVHFDGTDLELEIDRYGTRAKVIERSIGRIDTVLAAIGPDPRSPAAAIPQDAPDRTRAQIDAHEAKRLRLAARVQRSEALLATAEELSENAMDRGEIFEEMYKAAEALSERGIASRNRLYEMQAGRLEITGEKVRAQSAALSAQADRDEALSALDELHETFRDGLLGEREDLVAELEMVEQLRDDLTGKLRRLALKSPIDGVVHRLHVNTAANVVSPGGLVVEILPRNERLVSVIRLRPEAVGLIEQGDRVEMKLTAFNPRRYGIIEGRVERVSPTSSIDEENNPYFEVRVALASQAIGSDDMHHPLYAGLEVDAAIVTGRRLLIDYLIDPVAEPLAKAFREF